MTLSHTINKTLKLALIVDQQTYTVGQTVASEDDTEPQACGTAERYCLGAVGSEAGSPRQHTEKGRGLDVSFKTNAGTDVNAVSKSRCQSLAHRPPSVGKRRERGTTCCTTSAGCCHPFSPSFFSRTGSPGRVRQRTRLLGLNQIYFVYNNTLTT